jgi:hypothetical protein
VTETSLFQGDFRLHQRDAIVFQPPSYKDDIFYQNMQTCFHNFIDAQYNHHAYNLPLLHDRGVEKVLFSKEQQPDLNAKHEFPAYLEFETILRRGRNSTRRNFGHIQHIP